MAGIRDIDSGKVYIGQEEPQKLDQSDQTLNGDKPYDGTLAVTGPAFLGGHSKDAKGVANIGTDLGDFSPNVSGRAVDIEGDVKIVTEKGTALDIEGNTTQKGNTSQDGTINATGLIKSNSEVMAGGHQLTVKKNFDIPHPNIEGYRLRHCCVEGPEAAVYVRGNVHLDGIIELPDYWQNFVDKETITVHLTPIGSYQELYVKEIQYGKRVIIRNAAGGAINAYYQVWADRAGEKLIVEYEGKSAADYPGDSSMYSVAGYDYDVRDQETKTRKKGRFDKK